MCCGNQWFNSLEATTWVVGWELPLTKCIQTAITPDKPSIFDLTNIFDDFFRHVKRSLYNGTSGPDIFKMLLSSSASTSTTETEARPSPISALLG